MNESNLIINKVIYEKDEVFDKDVYPFNIEVIKNLDEISFNKPVTFFIGENGVGKSTLIEALAIALKLNPEGGSQDFIFSTNNTHSPLYNHFRIISSGKVAKTKFFLRAESFYNFSSEVEKIGEEVDSRIFKSYGGNLHNCSHGESFIKLIKNRFTDNGLYILDEPEAALSPTRQMSLLYLIDDLVKNGSQFIISTHSPILLSYKNSEIYDLNENLKKVKYEDTDIYKIYKLFLDNPDRMLHNLFENE